MAKFCRKEERYMRKVGCEEQRAVYGGDLPFTVCGRKLSSHCAGYYSTYQGKSVKHKKWYQLSYHTDSYCCHPDGGIYTYG